MNPFLARQLTQLEQQHPEAMVVAFSLEGRYLHVNDQCHELLGYHPAEMIGRDIIEFAAAEDMTHVAAAMEDALLNHESVTVTIRVKTKAGQLRLVRGAAQQVIDPDTGEVVLIGWVQAH